MFRWLSRYVKRIDVLGVGIELREIPPEEAVVTPTPPPAPATSQPIRAPVKDIDVMGLGIELREIPPEEAVVTPTSPPAPAISQPIPAPVKQLAPGVERQDFVSVTGTSASEQRSPREIDLMVDGDEIQVHIHQPGGNQPNVWVGRKDLQESLDRWKQMGGSAKQIAIPGRTARKESQVILKIHDSDEIEVQAGWWIWVGRQDLRSALEELGVRVPW